MATLHAFNGFADIFLVTPDKGLRDIYAMIGYTFDLGEKIGPLTFKAFYHDYETALGSDDLGDEFDAVMVKPIKIEGMPGTLNFLLKYADYDAPSGGADVERFIAEFNYKVSF